MSVERRSKLQQCSAFTLGGEQSCAGAIFSSEGQRTGSRCPAAMECGLRRARGHLPLAEPDRYHRAPAELAISRQARGTGTYEGRSDRWAEYWADASGESPGGLRRAMLLALA